MKTLALSLTLVASLVISQVSFANDSAQRNIDTITVTSYTDPASFEIYSLNHIERAIDKSTDLMVQSLSDETVDREFDNGRFVASTSSAI